MFALQLLPFLASLHLLQAQHTRPHYDFNYTVLSSSVALSVFILSPLHQQCQNCIPALIIAVCYPWHSVCYSVYSVSHQTKYFLKLKRHHNDIKGERHSERSAVWARRGKERREHQRAVPGTKCEVEWEVVLQ